MAAIAVGTLPFLNRKCPKTCLGRAVAQKLRYDLPYFSIHVLKVSRKSEHYQVKVHGRRQAAPVFEVLSITRE